MVVRIRLARFGRTNAPFYNIVVAQARTARNSRPMEVIGTYDPIPKPDSYDTSGKLHKDIKLDITRAKYWVGVGAQPSDTVWRLLSMLGILEPKYRAPPKAKSDPLAKHRDSIRKQREEVEGVMSKPVQRTKPELRVEDIGAQNTPTEQTAESPAQ